MGSGISSNIVLLLTRNKTQSMITAKHYTGNLVPLIGEKMDEVSSVPVKSPSNTEFSFFKIGKEIHRIDYQNIDFIIAYGNFSKIFMGKKSLLVGASLKEVEVKIGFDKFIRIHRSIIVSISKIEKVSDHTVIINNNSLAIGKIYKDEFYEKVLSY